MKKANVQKERLFRSMQAYLDFYVDVPKQTSKKTRKYYELGVLSANLAAKKVAQ